MAKKITVTSKSAALLESFVTGIEFVNDGAIEVQWVDDFCVVIMDEDDFAPDTNYFIDEFGVLIEE